MIAMNYNINGEATIDDLNFRTGIEINHTQHLSYTSQHSRNFDIILYIDDFHISQKLYEYQKQNKLFSLEYRPSEYIIYDCINCYIVSMDVNSINDSIIRINCDDVNFKSISKNKIRKKKLSIIKHYIKNEK